jgi:hypothetical protein
MVINYYLIKVVLGGVAITGGLSYLFKNKIYSLMGASGAQVVKNVVEDEEVKHTASQTILEIAKKLTRNPETLRTVNHFISGIVNDEKIKQEAKGVIKELITDQQTVNMTTLYLGKVLKDDLTKFETKVFIKSLIDDKQLNEIMIKYVCSIIDDPDTKKMLTSMFCELLQDSKLQDSVSIFLSDIFSRDDVRNNLNDLFADSSKTTINNNEVKREAENMIVQTLQSQRVIKQASDTCYNVLVSSVTPRWLASKEVASLSGSSVAGDGEEDSITTNSVTGDGDNASITTIGTITDKPTENLIENEESQETIQVNEIEQNEEIDGPVANTNINVDINVDSDSTDDSKSVESNPKINEQETIDSPDTKGEEIFNIEHQSN